MSWPSIYTLHQVQEMATQNQQNLYAPDALDVAPDAHAESPVPHQQLVAI